jgi:TonB family protein
LLSNTSNYYYFIKILIKMKTAIRSLAWKPALLWILLPGFMYTAMMCSKTLYEDEMAGAPKTEIPVGAVKSADGSLRQAGSHEDPEVFFLVEEMPVFMGGGPEAFRNYIAENLRYPATAADDGIEGRVFVQFVVKADGSVGEARIVRGVDPRLDREALRVVNESPKWTPGRQRGENVNVAFTFPVMFILNKDDNN